MSKTIYVEPGATVEICGDEYMCTLGDDCSKCELDHCDLVACSAEERVDEENVIFKKI